MTATKTPLAPDSAAELHDLVGNDATATFESDPKFIDSNPTGSASSEHIEVQRDTDDTADSEEEEEELEEEEEEEEDENDEDEDAEDEDEEEEENDEDEDEDEENEDEEEEDDEEEVGTTVVLLVGSTNVRSAVKIAKTTVKKVLEEEDAGDEGVDEDQVEDGSDSPETDRTIDAALRMSALATVAAEFAANV